VIAFGSEQSVEEIELAVLQTARRRLQQGTTIEVTCTRTSKVNFVYSCVTIFKGGSEILSEQTSTLELTSTLDQDLFEANYEAILQSENVQITPFVVNEPTITEDQPMTPSDPPSDVPSVQMTLSDTPSDVPSETTSSIPPTDDPSVSPSATLSSSPSSLPSLKPSTAPSGDPSVSPSAIPSSSPSSLPSLKPSTAPSHDPSVSPSATLSSSPSSLPSLKPSTAPSHDPSVSPSAIPSSSPSSLPSLKPSTAPSDDPSVSSFPFNVSLHQNGCPPEWTLVDDILCYGVVQTDYLQRLQGSNTQSFVALLDGESMKKTCPIYDRQTPLQVMEAAPLWQAETSCYNALLSSWNNRAHTPNTAFEDRLVNCMPHEILVH
jgi:hypothetical protein